MGIKGSPTCELVFRDAPAELVGDRRMGLIKYVMALMNTLLDWVLEHSRLG
jgi:alkylation response protein AidB-like acyl-CoA dehydrogenase